MGLGTNSGFNRSAADRWAGGAGYESVTSDSSIVADAVDAGAASPTATDVSSELQAFFASKTGHVQFPRNYDISTSTGGYRIGAQTIQVPRWTSFTGQGRVTQIYVDPDVSINYLFGLNSNGSGGMLSGGLPGILNGEIHDLYIRAADAAANGNYPCAFEVGNSCHVSRILFEGFAQGFEQIAQYLDQVVISDITFTQEDDGSGRYFINLDGAGDGVTLERNQSAIKVGTPGDYTTYERARSQRLAYKVGARITGSLNGDHELYGCDGIETEGWHMEFGQARLVGSSATLRNHNFWKADGEAPLLNVSPVYIGNISGIGNISPGIVTITDCGTILQQGFHGYAGVDTVPDIEIESGWRGQLHVERFYRKHRMIQTPAMGVKVGTTTSNAEFNTYSHLASVKSDIIQTNLILHGELPSMPATTVGVDPASPSVSDYGSWDEAGGTYYYKAAYIYDVPRRIGIVGSNEKIFTPTNGGASPVLLFTDAIHCMVRVWRGTSAGSYNKYVDIPLIAGGRLTDFGSNIMGYPWIDRTPAGADSFNSLAVLSYSIEPGEISTNANCYGRVVVRGKSTATVPTVGSWRRGDMVFVEQAGNTFVKVGEYKARFLGWKRMTDCTLASPSHVVGGPGVTGAVDWEPIHDIISYDNPGVITSDAAFTLTPRTSPVVNRHSGTLTADRTCTLDTASAKEGDKFHLTRTGSGAFNLSFGGLKNLATNTWAEAVYSNSGWRLISYGTL